MLYRIVGKVGTLSRTCTWLKLRVFVLALYRGLPSVCGIRWQGRRAYAGRDGATARRRYDGAAVRGTCCADGVPSSAISQKQGL